MGIAIHPLFAEALRAQLEQTAATEVPLLHLRASQWYAAHQAHSEAIQHALQAQAWPWAAHLSAPDGTDSPSGHLGSARVRVAPFLDGALPREVVRERPRLCLAYAQGSFWVASPAVTESWVRDARSAWTRAHLREAETGRARDAYEPEVPTPLLGEIATLQAMIASFYDGDAGATRAFCQEALTHLEEQQWAALPTLEGHQPAQLCWPYTHRARLLYEWNRLEETQHFVEQAIQLGEQAKVLTFLPLGYALLVRLALSQGRLKEAKQAYDRTRRLHPFLCG